MSNSHGIYGSNVTKRSTFLSTKRKTFVDVQSTLPAGRLVEYYLYVGRPSGVSQEFTWIRLQIWRPWTEDFHYKLVWERRVKVDVSHPEGLLYAVSTIIVI